MQALTFALAVLTVQEGGLRGVIGRPDPAFAAELARDPAVVVHWLTPGPETLAPAREAVGRLGLQGRVSFDLLRPPELPYSDHLLSGLVVLDASGIPEPELLRVLRPGGRLEIRGRAPLVKPRPAEIDEWGQWRHGADRNPVSNDRVVDVPRRIQWLSLQGKEGKDMVTGGGRAYYNLGGILQARDAFNGFPLWTVKIDSRCSPVAAGDVVYARLKSALAVLDGPSGRELRPVPDAGAPLSIALAGDVLFALNEGSLRVLVKEKLAWTREADRPRALSASGDTVFLIEGDTTAVALDLATGAPRWTRKDLEWTRHVHRSSTSNGVVSYEQGRYAAPKTALLLMPKDEPSAAHFLSARDGELLRDYAYKPAMRHDENARVFFVGGRAAVHRLEKDQATSHLAFFSNFKGSPELMPALPPKKENFYCYPPTATTRFFIYGPLGFTDWATGAHAANPLTRGSCGAWSEGVIPANGMVYIFPKSCNCFSMLSGMGALAPADPRAFADAHPLERGPAFDDPPGPPARPGDWPCHRGDAFRSGSNPVDVPVALATRWTSDLGAGWPAGPLGEEWKEYPYAAGALTPPVVADGRVIVAEPHAHRVRAVDVETGRPLWSYTANGRVDTPPTAHEGRILFGTRTGWIYSLRASDGVLAWRLRAAPAERHIAQFGQVESPWPVAGSVLVSGGTAYAAAGLHPLADGGIRVFALDPRTGAIRWTRRLTDMGYGEKGWHNRDGLEQDALDLMVRDGDKVALSRWIFDPASGDGEFRWQDAYYRIGDGYMQRGTWSYGYPMNRPRTRRPLLVGRGASVLGANRVREAGALKLFRRDFAPGEKFDVLWDEQPNDTASRIGQYFPANRLAEKVTWSAAYPGWIEAMALAGDRLALYAGGKLRLVSAKDGSSLREMDVPKPVWDGLAAAQGRLFLSTADGRLVCLGAP
jgi:outer membrane protein assembly factor BamB